jgi:hypothetical protein
MNHRMHLYLMAGVVAVGAVLLLTSGGSVFGGGLLLLLVLLGVCFALMFSMFSMMGGIGGDADDPGRDQRGTDRPDEFEDDAPQRK